MENNETKNFGYIKDTIDPKDYVLGALQLPTDTLVPSGQWDEFIPVDEIQRTEKYDTYNCTAFGTLNVLEFLFKRLFGETRNWSERYVGIAAGTRPPGNSPKKVIERIRKVCGLIDDELLPMSKAATVEEYYSPDPLPVLLTWKGEDFIKNYRINYEWVFSEVRKYNQKEAIKEALRYSPLGTAVYAWQYDFDKKVYVRPKDAEDNHWVCLYGFEEGKFWKVFDTYDDTTKQLDWNYDFDRVMRYRISKIEKVDFWGFLRRFFRKYKINLFQ